MKSRSAAHWAPVRLLAITAALALAGGPPPGAGAAPAEPFVIPAVLPLTGRFAFFGQAIQASLRLLEAKVDREGGIAGRPVRFDVKDDTSNPAVAVQVTQQILATRPAAILGSTIGALCSAQAPLMKNGPVEYCLSPVIHPPYGSFVFSASYSTHEQARAVLRYLKGRKLTRIALIASTDATGQDGESELQTVLQMPENASLALVAQEHFNTDDTTVAAQVARIKTSRPDALIVWTTGPQIATVFRAVNDAGLAVPVIVNNGNILVPLLTQVGPYLPKDLTFAGMEFLAPRRASDPTSKAVNEYLRTIEAANLPDDQFSALAWDPVLLIVDAYRAFGTSATAAQIRDYILSRHHWVGINGIYDFSDGEGAQRGLTSANVDMVRWSPTDHSWTVLSRGRSR